MSKQGTLMVRVLFLHEGDSYIAQCLEYDIVAQAKTLPEVKAAFERTFVGQIILDLHSGKEPLQGINRAPRIYWEKFEKALPIQDQQPLNLPKDTFQFPENMLPAFMIDGIHKELRVI